MLILAKLKLLRKRVCSQRAQLWSLSWQELTGAVGKHHTFSDCLVEVLLCWMMSRSPEAGWWNSISKQKQDLKALKMNSNHYIRDAEMRKRLIKHLDQNGLFTVFHSDKMWSQSSSSSRWVIGELKWAVYLTVKRDKLQNCIHFSYTFSAEYSWSQPTTVSVILDLNSFSYKGAESFTALIRKQLCKMDL